MNPITRFILRRAGLVAVVGTVLSIIGAYYSVRLYINLRTDFEELLPTTARSVIDLHEVTSRLESTEHLDVMIFSEKPEESKKFVDALAVELNKVDKDTIATVEYRIDRELKFFKDRRALFMDKKDLVRVRDYVRNRLGYEKTLRNPLTIFRGQEYSEPVLDFYSLRGKYENRVSSYTRFKDGYYASEDGKIRIVIINIPGKHSAIDKAYTLKRAVARAIHVANPSKYDANMRIRYTGGIQNLIEEHESLLADLELTTIIVMVLVSAVLLIFFRSIMATVLLTVTLLMGTFWAFGISFFAVGYLNANSAFLGAIIVGNGINFGIILLARYIEERRLGRGNARAIHFAMTTTATATWTAALAAGLAYGSLVLTAFRGFRQFGVIGLIGMVCCWISAYTLFPAFLTLYDRWKGFRFKERKPSKQYFTNWVVRFVSRWPKTIWGTSLALAAFSIGISIHYDGQIIQTDLSKLRDKESMRSGSGYLGTVVNQVFQRELSPVVVLPKNRDDARKIAAKLKEVRERYGKQSFMNAVLSLDDFVPRDQEEKIRLLREIKRVLNPRVTRHLSFEEKQEIREFFSPESFRTFDENDLPHLIRTKFTEKNGAIGNLVLVEPPVTNELWDGANLTRFISLIRSSADEVRPRTAVAGQIPLTSDMFDAVRRDGPQATLFAFLAVVVLCFLLFRNFRTTALVLFSLILGVVWLAGFMFGGDIKINFLNFIALPITFGIGVDYGVNIFQRYRLEGPGRILTVIRQTGGAVGLASLTTIIGWGALLIAGNQAFVSFGKVAVLGEITCVIGALISLPAFLCYRTQIHDTQKARFKALDNPRAWPQMAMDFVIRSLQNWPMWWKAIGSFEKYWPAALVLVFWICFGLVGSMSAVHIIFGLAFLILAYSGTVARGTIDFFLPFAMTIMTYAILTRLGILGTPSFGAYEFDHAWFSVTGPEGPLTGNEWWKSRLSPVMDFVTGATFILVVPGFILVAAYFRYWLGVVGTYGAEPQDVAKRANEMGWAFFFVSLAGYLLAMFKPSFPPWYVEKFGREVMAMADLKSDMGRAPRFDSLLGTSFFGPGGVRWLGSGISMHVAYATVLFWYAMRFSALRSLSLALLFASALAGVYLNLHYTIDLIGGVLVASGVLAALHLWSTKVRGAFKKTIPAPLPTVEAPEPQRAKKE